MQFRTNRTFAVLLPLATEVTVARCAAPPVGGRHS